MRLGCLALVLMLVSCAPSPTASPSPPAFHGLSFSGDTIPETTRRATRAPSPEAAGATIFVDFDGASLSCANDYAPSSQSSLVCNVGNAVTVPPFNGSIPAPKVSAEDAKVAIYDRLRTFYLPYDVTFTRTRPAGDFTLIAVGGNMQLLGFQSGVAGVSPLDCGNANPDNVVFTFSNDLSPDYGGVVSAAITAAHESGHSFGLQHTNDPNDIMYSVQMPNQTLDQLFKLSFTGTGTFSGFNAGESAQDTVQCGRPTAQVNNGVLAQALGSRAVPPPPSFSWDFPPPTVQQVPTSFSISVTPQAGARVEVYKNADLIAVIKSAPYSLTVTADAADANGYYLTVEAIDSSAARATLSRAFLPSAKSPALCRATTDCSGGLQCKNGYCLKPVGAACMKDIDCAGNLCKQTSGGMVCTQLCDATTPCPDGTTCSGGLCAPGSGADGGALKNDGDACSDGSECASGRCQDVCVAACDDQTPCADGSSCMDVSGGKGCVGASPSPSPSPAASGCAMTGAPGPAPLSLLALACAILGLARRRRV